jgi:G3E family GTPase
VCVTVDAINGRRHLDSQGESLKQVAVADRLVITKIDLVEQTVIDALVERLRHLNPAARLELAAGGEVQRVLPPAGEAPTRRLPPTSDSSHLADVRTVAIDPDNAVDWQAFGVWLTMLLHAHGEEVLRVKGVVETQDAGRVAVNGVQHVIHPPEHVPSESLAKGLLIIGRGVDADLVRRSFFVFQRAGGT